VLLGLFISSVEAHLLEDIRFARDDELILLPIISLLVLIILAIVVIWLFLAILKVTKNVINIIREKSPVTGLIISAIFVTIISLSILSYFVWKNPTDKSPENKSSKAPLQKEESTTQQVQSRTPLLAKEPVLTETSTEHVKPHVFILPKEKISQSGKIKSKEKTKDKLLKPSKPSKTIFSVQVGAYYDFYNAKSLKTRLYNKGYSVYITSSTTIKEGSLYKVIYRVWIGKFSNREKAEILCDKIKKADGLQAFVISS